jgi:hypothetical protein
MINMKHVSPQLILPCIVGYYFLIKVAGRGLTATFLDISTFREVMYLVATISVGAYLIAQLFTSLLNNLPTPKIMYGVSEPIEEEEDETEEEEEEDPEVEVEEDETEVEEEGEEQDETEEDDDSDSDYVPPKTRSRRRPEASVTEEETKTDEQKDEQKDEQAKVNECVNRRDGGVCGGTLNDALNEDGVCAACMVNDYLNDEYEYERQMGRWG